MAQPPETRQESIKEYRKALRDLVMGVEVSQSAYRGGSLKRARALIDRDGVQWDGSAHLAEVEAVSPLKKKDEEDVSRIRADNGALEGEQHAKSATSDVRSPVNYYGKPLYVGVVDGVLVIQIGVETLAHATAFADWANPYNDEKKDYIRTFAITNALAFAKDVALAMEREEEDGSSPLTRFLDKAAEDALDEGSEACEFEQSIPTGTTSPLETWALETERSASASHEAASRAVSPAQPEQCDVLEAHLRSLPAIHRPYTSGTTTSMSAYVALVDVLQCIRASASRAVSEAPTKD